MTYRKEISFPMEPTKEDMKKLRRQVARDKFKALDGRGDKTEGKHLTIPLPIYFTSD